MTLIPETVLERQHRKAKKYIQTHIREHLHLSKQSRDKARQAIQQQVELDRAKREAMEMELCKKREQKLERRAYYQSRKHLSETIAAIPAAENKKQQPMTSPSRFVGDDSNQPEEGQSVPAIDKHSIIFASTDVLGSPSSDATAQMSFGPAARRELSHVSKNGSVSPSHSIIIAANVTEKVIENCVSPQSFNTSR